MITRILILMHNKGITAKQLTTELELSSSSITDWKKGKAKPSTDAIIKLANFFNVSTDYLLTGKEATLSTKPLDPEDTEWLSLIHKLPIEKQYEFKGELKGYLRHLEETVAADDHQGKSLA